MNPNSTNSFGFDNFYGLSPSHSNELTDFHNGCSFSNNSANQGVVDINPNSRDNNFGAISYENSGDNNNYSHNQHMIRSNSVYTNRRNINNFANPNPNFMMSGSNNGLAAISPNFDNNIGQNSVNMMRNPRSSFINNRIVTNNNFVDQDYIKSQIQEILQTLNTLYQLLDSNGIH